MQDKKTQDLIQQLKAYTKDASIAAYKQKTLDQMKNMLNGFCVVDYSTKGNK